MTENLHLQKILFKFNFSPNKKILPSLLIFRLRALVVLFSFHL